MDVIESVVRSLVREGKINRARALLSVFEDEYPHLLLEVESAAGNWKIVKKIYQSLPKDLQKEYEILYKTAQEKSKEDYTQDMREAVSEMTKQNFEGALALLEGITRKHPELIEAIALKYEIARRKGDISKARRLEEILKSVDPSHPVLAVYATRSERRKQVAFGLESLLMLISILVVLVISIVSLILTPKISHFQSLENKLSDVEKAIESVIPQIKPSKNGLTAQDVERVVKSALEETLSEVKPATVSIDLSGVMAGINEIKAELSNLSVGMREVMKELKNIEMVPATVVAYAPSTPVELSEVAQLQNWERVYKPASELDRAKIYWLAGYIMYLKGMYGDAVRLFNKSLDIVRAKYPAVYFRDDCEYYRALSYYMMGDLWQAKKLFEEFIIRFPRSQYADDAQYFLDRIGGS